MFQHHPKALNMILNEPKYVPIIDIDLKKFKNKIIEGNHYYYGKNNKSILESKGNYRILETIPLHRKGCLVLIFLCDSDMMVAREPISKRIKFLTPNTFYYLIHKWSWKWVM